MLIGMLAERGKPLLIGFMGDSDGNSTDDISAGAQLAIGAKRDGSNSFNGSIDQVHIWNRTLSASEIAMLYHNGAGFYNRTHSDATSEDDVWTVVVTPSDGYEEGMEAGLGHGYTLRDPTYAEAVAFLREDKTDENEYIEDT